MHKLSHRWRGYFQFQNNWFASRFSIRRLFFWKCFQFFVSHFYFLINSWLWLNKLMNVYKNAIAQVQMESSQLELHSLRHFQTIHELKWLWNLIKVVKSINSARITCFGRNCHRTQFKFQNSRCDLIKLWTMDNSIHSHTVSRFSFKCFF